MIKINESKVIFKTFKDFIKHYGEKEAIRQVLGSYSNFDFKNEVEYDIKLSKRHSDGVVRYDMSGLTITGNILRDALKYVERKYKNFNPEDY